MWYELLPAASVPIKLKVFPGNAVTASVKVNGTKVTLQIKNLSRKTTFTKTLRMSAPDLSSAEWVAEAPSACNSAGRCIELPLSNFGSLSFTRASTTADAHTGAIADPGWTATMIQLVANADSPFISNGQTSTGAFPSALSTDGTSFRIDWQAASGGSP
jgi:Peptidase A4 family